MSGVSGMIWYIFRFCYLLIQLLSLGVLADRGCLFVVVVYLCEQLDLCKQSPFPGTDPLCVANQVKTVVVQSDTLLG